MTTLYEDCHTGLRGLGTLNNTVSLALQMAPCQIGEIGSFDKLRFMIPFIKANSPQNLIQVICGWSIGACQDVFVSESSWTKLTALGISIQRSLS